MTRNLMLAFDIKSLDIMGWATLVVAVSVLCLFFGDLIVNIRKRRNTGLNILGLLSLTISLACFLWTVFYNDNVILSFAAIGFLVGYFFCDVLTVVQIGKARRRGDYQSTPKRTHKRRWFHRKNKVHRVRERDMVLPSDAYVEYWLNK